MIQQEKERKDIIRAVTELYNGVDKIDLSALVECVLQRQSELHKLSEESKAKITELLWAFSCDASSDPKEITEEIIRIASMGYPSENIQVEPLTFRDQDAPMKKLVVPSTGTGKMGITHPKVIVEVSAPPSDLIGQADKELIEKIETILDHNSIEVTKGNYATGEFAVDSSDFITVATEIAQFLPSMVSKEQMLEFSIFCQDYEFINGEWYYKYGHGSHFTNDQFYKQFEKINIKKGKV